MAVLPFCRVRWLRADALMIGSMSPDYEHMLRFAPVTLFSHTWLGLVVFCLPVGLAVTWWYREYGSKPLGQLFPQPLRTAWDWPAEIASVGFGAVTHLIWDSFTHEDRFGPELVPALNQEVLQVLGRSVRAWNLLQHSSTVFGLGLLAYLIWRARRRSQEVAPLLSRPILGSALGCGALACAMTVVYQWFETRPMSTEYLIRSSVVLTANYLLITFTAWLVLQGWLQKNSIRVVQS